MTRTLDFIVIGAQKAGTTSLFEYLKAHPQLHFPWDKERPYFSHERAVRRGWDEYLARNFSSASPDLKWGTITPHYMAGTVVRDEEASPGAAPTPFSDEPPERIVPLRIHSQLPEVRLSALLRDPVRRCVSQYRMNVLLGWEQRSFAQIVEELLDPEALATYRMRFSPTTSYVAYGEYGRILEPYFDIFGADRVLVQFTRDLQERPVEMVQELLRFVGVDDGYVPDNAGRRYHEASAGRRIGWLDPPNLQRRIARQGTLRWVWHRVPPAARGRIDRGFSRAALSVHLWNRRGNDSPPPPVDDDSLERLREFYATDRRRLEALLGRQVPWGEGASQTAPST